MRRVAIFIIIFLIETQRAGVSWLSGRPTDILFEVFISKTTINNNNKNQGY